MRTSSIDLGDVTISYTSAGEPTGPLAVLLHGFPDTNYTFRYLMPYLACLGYHVVAPAMRGYAPSSISASGDYHTTAVAHDVNQLHEALGGGSDAVLIGHDWGAVAAYAALASAPQRWRKGVTMSVPPTPLMAQAFMTYDQLRLSWYMFFFQSPLADIVVSLNELSFIDQLWNDWSPGYAHEDDFASVRTALGTPENLGAALGYYRAMFTPPQPKEELQYMRDSFNKVPDMPVLYLHGENDGCIAPSVTDGTLQFLATGSEMDVLPGLGHFLHLEDPDTVHHLIGEFLGR